MQIKHTLLLDNVRFYEILTENEQLRFREMVLFFCQNIKISGLNIDINEIHLVAAAAIIPIFYTNVWPYDKVRLINLTDNPPELKLNSISGDFIILGHIVRTKMGNDMILWKRALQDSFSKSQNEVRNVAIHEFVHLIDCDDGNMDGLPKILLNKRFHKLWLEIVRNEMKKVKTGLSIFDWYAGHNYSEFLATSVEYYFIKKDLLSKENFQLFSFIDDMLKGKLS